MSRVALTIAAALSLACSTTQTLRGAMPLGRGEAEVGLDGSLQRLPGLPPPRNPPLTSEARPGPTWPGLDLSFRYGVTDSTTPLLRAGCSGLTAGVDQFLFERKDAFAIAAFTTFNVRPALRDTSTGSFDGYGETLAAGAILESRWWFPIHVLLSPGVQVIASPVAEDAVGTNLALRPIYGANAGLFIELAGRVRLVSEVGLWSGATVPVIYVNTNQPTLQAGVALQLTVPSQRSE